MLNIKNIALLFILCAITVSCVTTTETAKTLGYNPETYSATVADLKVSDKRVDYTMSPVPKDILRGGENNVKKAAEYEALKRNGEGDILVEPEYIVSKKRTLFGSKISSITVTGRPATYMNFRSLNDTVWSNPVFRNRPYYKLAKGNSHLNFSKKNQSPNQSNVEWKGFRKYISLDISKGNWSDETCDFEKLGEFSFAGSLTFTLGYQFNKNLFLGAGIGIMAQVYDVYSVPLYIEGRWNFIGSNSNTKVSPFVDLRIGKSFVVDERLGDTYDDFRYYGSELHSNLSYVSPSVGLSFRCKNKHTFDVALQMTFLSGETDGNYSYGWWRSDDVYSSMYGIRLGYSF